MFAKAAVRLHYRSIRDCSDIMISQSGITQLMGKEVTPDALKLYVTFVQENAICMPERNKPAPTRRKDETAAAWLGVSLLSSLHLSVLSTK